ncbi:hypothetical protein F5141DRAFT_1214602 [Pisolithus sp. B1]|nr:hypothetical protein F5141DRAFT_1214602 [Pisolithus sp. B1]
MNPIPITSVDANCTPAVLCKLAMTEVGPTEGNKDLLAGLSNVETTIRATVNPPYVALSSSPLTPSVTTNAPSVPLALLPDAPSTSASCNCTLILQSILVAAAEVLDKSIEGQGMLEKVLGKH